LHFVMYIYTAFGSSSLVINTYLAQKKYESISIPMSLFQTGDNFYNIFSEFLSEAQLYNWPNNISLLPTK
ncbi:MAG: hypothetical protein K2M80_07950, partial [Muribaculaceae bacterium]|nr:hypothetical protein [Muribaculaceae bacterium]